MSIAELSREGLSTVARLEPEAPFQPLPSVELTIVIPTLNERDNVPLIVKRLKRALAWRQSNIRCLQRLGRRGLSSACIEGMLSSAARYLAVMDGDLQHDETLLPRMLDKIKADRLDVVVASRHVGDGSLGGMEQSRVAISGFATKLSRFVVKAELSDPMSGFFMIERSAFTGAMRLLSGQGFKILLDL